MNHCSTCSCVSEPAPQAYDSPSKAAQKFRELLTRKKQEHLMVLYLDGRSNLLSAEVVSVGTLTASLVHPREIFAPAIEHRAAGIILGHNHPSDDSSPSMEDRETTKRIKRAGDILGILLIDHIIVTKNSYYSFRNSGAM